MKPLLSTKWAVAWSCANPVACVPTDNLTSVMAPVASTLHSTENRSMTYRLPAGTTQVPPPFKTNGCLAGFSTSIVFTGSVAGLVTLVGSGVLTTVTGADPGGPAA